MRGLQPSAPYSSAINALDRRSLLRNAVFADSSLAVTQRAFSAGKPPSETINAAVIGLGWRGGELLNQILGVPGVKVTWLVDVDETLIAKAKQSVPMVKTSQDLRHAIEDTPLFPALRSGPTAVSGATRQKQFPCSLKPGETLWSNHTDHRIVAKLGENKISVDPHGQTVSKDPVSASGYYRAEFTYQPQGEGDSQRITEQSWWHDPSGRYVGFIVNTGGKLPKLFFYRDFRPQD